jgi:hypothetical protein
VARSPAVLGPFVRAFLFGLALVSCKREQNAPRGSASASANAAASAPAGPIRGIRISTPTAFELVVSARGATLVLAKGPGSGIDQLELDPFGLPMGSFLPALGPGPIAGEVSDLGAAWVAERLTLSWIERRGANGTVRAAVGRARSEQARKPDRVHDLGAAWLGPRTARGNLAVIARGAAGLVFARGSGAPCVEPGQNGCFGFSFHEVTAERAKQTGLPLVVPVPCTDDSTAIALEGTRLYYGVCTDSGKAPVTTLFSIEQSPAYARADRLLEGCKPRGLFAWGGGTWLIGDCQGGRRAVRVTSTEQGLELLDLENMRFECRHGEARLRAAGFDLMLDEPRGRLEALLPPEMAAAGARAVWSGRALLVAATIGQVLAVKRTTCSGDRAQTQGVGEIE